MLRFFKAFFHDMVSWVLLILLFGTVVVSMTALFKRYEHVDRLKSRLVRMEYDIAILKNDLKSKSEWVERLQQDRSAFEQVAREKMNYLGPNEVLVTFSPVYESHQEDR